MDTIRTIYTPLFNVKLEHMAYTFLNANTIFNDIKVLPDEKTKILFNRNAIGYRCINDAIVCFIRTELSAPPAALPKQPYHPLDTIAIIRFIITASPRFLMNTYITPTGSRFIYHFTNKVINVENGINYLSKITAVYDATATYDASTAVLHNGELYASLQPVDGNASINIGNTAYWKKLPASTQLVNNADLQPVANVNTSTPATAVIDIYNTGTANPAYNLLGPQQQLLSPTYYIPFKSKYN